MKAVVAAFNQEKALVGAFSVIMNLRMELSDALLEKQCEWHLQTWSEAHFITHLPAVSSHYRWRPSYLNRITLTNDQMRVIGPITLFSLPLPQWSPAYWWHLATISYQLTMRLHYSWVLATWHGTESLEFSKFDIDVFAHHLSTFSSQKALTSNFTIYIL